MQHSEPSWADAIADAEEHRKLKPNRIVQGVGGWYFMSSEGSEGPFVSNAEAKLALSRYMLEVQFKALADTSSRDAMARPRVSRREPTQRG